MQRYDLVKVSSSDYHHDHVMEEDERGDWVKYEDVREMMGELNILRESEKHRKELIEDNNQLRSELSDTPQLVQKYQNELWEDGKQEAQSGH